MIAPQVKSWLCPLPAEPPLSSVNGAVSRVSSCSRVIIPPPDGHGGEWQGKGPRVPAQVWSSRGDRADRDLQLKSRGQMLRQGCLDTGPVIQTPIPTTQFGTWIQGVLRLPRGLVNIKYISAQNLLKCGGSREQMPGLQCHQRTPVCSKGQNWKTPSDIIQNKAHGL